ncbi:hypothetical protein BBta_3532 [Bradyrhizobium sp. BTAi1]|nr:hypothetical protein BBta_3532 [Bradyrhizobium sp. BTAi1]
MLPRWPRPLSGGTTRVLQALQLAPALGRELPQALDREHVGDAPLKPLGARNLVLEILLPAHVPSPRMNKLIQIASFRGGQDRGEWEVNCRCGAGAELPVSPLLDLGHGTAGARGRRGWTRILNGWRFLKGHDVDG